jgi:phytoene dehydrogenase-like protein
VSKHYAAIVVGGGLSATISAALLAKRGMRGLLIDQGELTSLEREIFDLIPSEDRSIAMGLVHSELSVREDLKIKAVPVAPLLQVIFPDARLDLHANRGDLTKEVGRRLSNHTEQLGTFLGSLDVAEEHTGEFLANAGEIPPAGFFARRTFSSAAKKHPEIAQSLEGSGLFPLDEGPISELLMAPIPFLSHLDCRRPDQATVARFARVMGRFLRGLSRFEDGRSLRKVFLDLAERKGFSVERTAVESIAVDGKKLEVRLSGRRDAVSTDFLIDASSDLSGVDAFTPKKKELALLLQSAKPRGSLQALGIEADVEMIPPGLGLNVLLLNGRKDRSRFDENDPEGEDRPIWLSVEPATKLRVRLIALHPVSSALAHAQRYETLDRAVRARVGRVIPFLDEGHPEPIRVEIDHPLYQHDLDPTAGIAGVPTKTAIKNVFLAGPAVLPGLGIEGAYLSALQAADEVDAAASGAKRPKVLAARV